MGFLLLLSFYTRLPVPRVAFNEQRYRKAMPLLPLVGLVIGVALTLLACAADVFKLPVLVKGAILLVSYIIITGGLHLDGLADSCDGLFCGRDRERSLEIMKDSHIGSFGVLALIAAGVSYLVLFSYATLPAVLVMAIVGRAAPALSSALAPPARQGGMGAQAGRPSVVRALVASVLVAFAVCALAALLDLFMRVGDGSLANDFASGFASNLASSLACSLVSSLTPAIFALLSVVLFTRYIKRQIGGFTGDTLGASIELSQIVFLLTAQILASCVVSSGVL